jgi:peptide/nickel transport system permease protein
MVLILIGVLVATFFISRVLPGSPVEMLLGSRPTAEAVERVTQEMGLDRPLVVQFVLYMRDVLQGDFGMSLMTKRPVLTEIGERFPATLELVLCSVLLVIVVGVPLGVFAALRQNGAIDVAARSVSAIGVAIPTFLIAMMLQLVLSGQLRLLPLQGRIDDLVLLDYEFPAVTGLYLIDSLLAGQWPAFTSAAAHLVMPTLALSLSALALIVRITRTMMIEALGEEFVTTLRAYGLSGARVNFRYVLKAAMIPLLTVVGLTFGYLLGTSVVAEFVFDWPGIGGFIVRAITKSDYPSVMAITMLLATAYLLITFLIDMLHYAVDPRLRH